MISCQRLHRDPQMSHFKFTLPGNHIPLLHTGSRGFQNPPHQHTLALPPSTSTTLAPQLCRDPQGLALTSANCVCRKIKKKNNKSEVCSADNNARPCWSQACVRAWAGRGGDGSQREAAPWRCAESGHSASASCSSVPAAVTRAATPPRATAPTAIKRRFPHFQPLCGKGLGAGWDKSSYRLIWHQKVLSAKAALPHLGAQKCPKGAAPLGSALSLIWG